MKTSLPVSDQEFNERIKALFEKNTSVSLPNNTNKKINSIILAIRRDTLEWSIARLEEGRDFVKE